jgi:hypothetical protein
MIISRFGVVSFETAGSIARLYQGYGGAGPAVTVYGNFAGWRLSQTMVMIFVRRIVVTQAFCL